MIGISSTRKRTHRLSRPTSGCYHSGSQKVAAPQRPVNQRERGDVFAGRPLDRLHIRPGRQPAGRVQKFPVPDGKWQVSTGARAAHPRWGTDGKELFFDIVGTMAFVSVTASGGAELKHGAQKTLFAGLLGGAPHNFDVADAGQRFLVQLVPSETLPIAVVVNWKSGLSLGR